MIVSHVLPTTKVGKVKDPKPGQVYNEGGYWLVLPQDKVINLGEGTSGYLSLYNLKDITLRQENLLPPGTKVTFETI